MEPPLFEIARADLKATHSEATNLKGISIPLRFYPRCGQVTSV